MVRRVRTSGGLDLTVSEAQPGDHDELYVRFGEIVAAGEGYPQAPGPLAVDDFDEYWTAGKSLVAVARSQGTLAGSYYLKPNFPGRAAHIANGGYFVVRELRGLGVGSALVEDSLVQARKLGFDALQFNLVFASNPARRLYERMGFEAVGRIPEAVDGEDAIVYWRRL
ncbi:MAG TPA: GNAT family N-acetyltransferase [Acidimicrobiales bacterium]|nr:GNAT family N-acetyltransferase [Acidimicrobiales bacterium]